MSTPTVADYLKYVNLQMAAAAFIANDNGSLKGDVIKALMDGNNHASKFTETEATKFNTEWRVVSQCPNTSSGFSGTLFENKTTHKFVTNKMNK